ncbi:MAG: DUF1707 and DUF2154 domain-containing protein [Spirochaetales bacterium]|nr:DUF1707 and DUF2154 domain-containing protein [Spirochaetales bacterium]
MREMQEFDQTPLVQVREFVVEQLKLNFAHDNLEVDEFEARLEKAHQIASKQPLLELVADLPRLKDEESKEVTHYEGSVAINTGRIKESSSLVAILGGNTRKGVWKPARTTRIISVLGGTELDYSEALMPPGVIDLDVFCLLGGAEITVPPGVNVDVDLIPVLGGVENNVDTSEILNAPTLRIRGFIALGGLEINTKKQRKRKR